MTFGRPPHATNRTHETEHTMNTCPACKSGVRSLIELMLRAHEEILESLGEVRRRDDDIDARLRRLELRLGFAAVGLRDEMQRCTGAPPTDDRNFLSLFDNGSSGATINPAPQTRKDPLTCKTAVPPS